MTDSVILRENQEGIEFITINRPDKLNALNSEVIEYLDHILPELTTSPAIQAVVFTGAGDKSFVAGADISQFPRYGPMEAKVMSLTGQDILNRIEKLPKPVIAAMNGLALGGGLELAMACHIRLAASTARMGQPEVKLGIIPGYGGTQRLARLVGKGRALELVTRGNMITAQQAMEMGLVNHVVDPEQLIEETIKVAREILANGQIAVRTAIEAIHHGLNLPFEEGCELEANLFATLFSTDDQKEGARAFLEKRPPAFKNK
jgi:enoyl-CoA hydratase